MTTAGPPAPWADKEAFCDAWGAFADLLGSFSDPRAALQEGSLIGELRRAVEETATDSMEDEVRDLLAALEAPLTVEGVPTLDVVVQGAVAQQRLERWHVGTCPGPDGSPPAAGVWQPEFDNHPLCVAVERYLTAVQIADAGSGDRELPIVTEALVALAEQLPESERLLAEQLPTVYLDEDATAELFDGTTLAAECGLGTEGP